MSTIQAVAQDPVSSGCFFLPGIDPDVPVDLDQGLKRQEVLARFSHAAKKAGIKLPSGQFLTIEQVVKAQWQQFTESTFPSGTFRMLAGAPEIEINNEKLQITIASRSTLNAFRLKPVVEALEQSEAGLGWFVESVIRSASRYGHELYTMGHITYMMESQFCEIDEFTDEAYARAMLEQEGKEPDAGPIPDETMARLKVDYSYWPSYLLEEAGGHSHLISWGRSPVTVLKPSMAKRWLAQHPRHQHAKTVDLALQIRALFHRAKQDFTWYGYDDDSDTIGALAFVTWDDPELLFEAVNHHEEMQYQGGTGVEAFARCQVPLDSETIDADLRRMAKATMNYLNRWALLEKLLSKFPIWEGGDDV